MSCGFLLPPAPDNSELRPLLNSSYKSSIYNTIHNDYTVHTATANQPTGSVVLRVLLVWIIPVLYPVAVLVYDLDLAPELELLAESCPSLVYVVPVVPLHELAPDVVAH